MYYCVLEYRTMLGTTSIGTAHNTCQCDAIEHLLDEMALGVVVLAYCTKERLIVHTYGE
mgnify:CR=1 FL=1